jgi:hypothetical protein
MIFYKLDFIDGNEMKISLKEVLQYLKEVNIDPNNVDLVIRTITTGYDGSHDYFQLEYVEK